MKKYIIPAVCVMHTNVCSPLLAGSMGKITGGGSNAGQVNPTAESKGYDGWDYDLWTDDEE